MRVEVGGEKGERNEMIQSTGLTTEGVELD
jgi:hypothetical protein